MRPVFRALPLLLLTAGAVAVAQDDEPAPTTDPGPGAPPTPGDAQKDGEDAVQQPEADRPADAPPVDEPPKGSDGAPTSSVLMTFERAVPKVGEWVTAQADIQGKGFVTFTGTATCKGCEGQLMLMLERRDDPTDKLPRIITTKRLEGPGDFTLLVPEMSEAVILHLLVDTDGSGSPTRGERSAMLEKGGKLVPTADQSGLNLDATAQE